MPIVLIHTLHVIVRLSEKTIYSESALVTKTLAMKAPRGLTIIYSPKYFNEFKVRLVPRRLLNRVINKVMSFVVIEVLIFVA